jgi:hypothetical protein
VTDEPRAAAPDRPGVRIRRPGWFLLLLVATCIVAGTCIYWLIRSARI